MDDHWDNLSSLCRPRDHRSIVDWSREWVKPVNSARSQSGFDPDLTPHLIEPINAHADPSLRLIACMMPTGAGKTVILDCTIPYEICEAPGSILLGVQGNDQAKLHVQARLMPTLQKIPHVARIMAGMNRHKIKSDAVIFPHLTLYMGGINKTNGQMKSVDRVKLDEVWEATPHGIVGEFEARMHDRPLRLMTLVSQGGTETIPGEDGPVTSEWESYWRSTDQQEFHWRCPECGGVQRFRLRGADPRGYGLRYDRGAKDGEIDEAAVQQSARLACLDRCGTEFADTPQNRYALAKSGSYLATHPTARPEFRGYHCNVLALHYVPWADTALRHARAIAALKRGDSVPISIFRQKRMAENVRAQDVLPQTALTIGTIGEGEDERPYKFEDYADGQLWAGEALRIMTIDCQLDHFWAWVQAFKADGSARLLYFDKVSTEEGLRALQLRMKVKPLELARPMPSFVYIDCGFNQERAFTMAGKYGWWALRGEGTKGKLYYRHTMQLGRETRHIGRYYSPTETVQAASGFRCREVKWLNLPVKRITEKMRGGYREPYEFPADMGPERTKQLFSEIERDGAFVKLHKDNHGWDCANMATVAAITVGVLPDKPEIEKEYSPA